MVGALIISTLLPMNRLAAQKIVNEATFNYNITIESVNDKTALSKSLQGASLTVYLKAGQSRSDMVSALGTESDYFDAKSGKGTILKQYSGQKLMITLTADNWNQKNSVNQAMKFTIESGEQEIAGFKCKKATGQSADGKTVVIFFSPDVVLANKKYDNAFPQLPGLPVQYELQSGQLKFKYTLSNINYEPVAAAKFEIPKTGYRVMTYQENQQLRKGEN
jgi:GLPGLI family protein